METFACLEAWSFQRNSNREIMSIMEFLSHQILYAPKIKYEKQVEINGLSKSLNVNWNFGCNQDKTGQFVSVTRSEI